MHWGRNDFLVVSVTNSSQSAVNGEGGENLEAMLGTLTDDLSRQGISTVPKGHCAACTKPIVGQVSYPAGVNDLTLPAEKPNVVRE